MLGLKGSSLWPSVPAFLCDSRLFLATPGLLFLLTSYLPLQLGLLKMRGVDEGTVDGLAQSVAG